MVNIGPVGPQSPRKKWKKSRLKKKLQTQISAPRWWDGILKYITKLLTKMCSTTWHNFFRAKSKKIFDFFLPLPLKRSPKILGMVLKIWTFVSTCPSIVSIFWDHSRFSSSLGKIQTRKSVQKSRKKMSQNPLVPLFNGPYTQEDDLLKIPKPTQQMSGGCVYATQKTV